MSPSFTCTATTMRPILCNILREVSVVQTPYVPLWRFEAALCPGPIKEGVPAVPELAQSPEETPAEPAAAEPEPEPEPEQATESKVSRASTLAPHCQWSGAPTNAAARVLRRGCTKPTGHLLRPQS